MYERSEIILTLPKNVSCDRKHEKILLVDVLITNKSKFKNYNGT